MRWVVLGLLLLVGFLQYRLWVGAGGMSEVWDLRQEIALQKLDLERVRARNDALAAEVEDLRDGLDALEERARNELGMIKEGEVFLQVIEAPAGLPSVPKP